MELLLFLRMEKKMKARITKWSCSCGCTPTQYVNITSETKDGLLWGCAVNFNGHRRYGADPYAKCSVEIEEGDATREEIVSLAKQISVFDEQIHKLDSELKHFEEFNVFLPPFECRKGYKLTDEQIKINIEEKEKFEQNTKDTIKQTREKIGVLYNERLLLKKGDYEEEYESSEDYD